MHDARKTYEPKFPLARQKKSLMELKEGDRINPAEYQSRFGGKITARQAARDLFNLTVEGYMRRFSEHGYERTEKKWFPPRRYSGPRKTR